MMKLDDWDFRFIKLCKSGNPTLPDFCQLWAERCLLYPTHTGIPKAIVLYFLPILIELSGDRSSTVLQDVIVNAADAGGYWSPDTPYWQRLLLSIMGQLGILPAINIPGYRHYITSMVE